MNPTSPALRPDPAIDERELRRQVDEFRELVHAIRAELQKVIVGQEALTSRLLMGLFLQGHVLLEGPPGLGKTLLLRTLSQVLNLTFKRVQFTPDLMPADILGTRILRQSGEDVSFEFEPGPVFTNLLMADEINRASPKTQSALLEAMQEHQVTSAGVSHPLPSPFLVLATQNPIEMEGTYPLPEAQLDRFLARVPLGLPAAEAELEIYRRAVGGSLAGWNREVALPAPLAGAGEAAALRRASRLAHVAEELLAYLQALATQVRSSPHVELGPSPRAGLALLELSRAGAILEGRGHVVPDDLRRYLGPCWGHRVIVRPESELEGLGVAQVLDQAAAAVPVPR